VLIDDVVVTVNPGGFWQSALQAFDNGRGYAITVNRHWIVTDTAQAPGPTQGTAPFLHDPDWQKHEFGHTQQAQALGTAYLPLYVAELGLTFANIVISRHVPTGQLVHEFHPMELDANRRAGLRWNYPY
jgi:hypothetical protein